MSYFDILNSIEIQNFNFKNQNQNPYYINIRGQTLNEDTTEDAVAFIPAHLGAVKAKVADLAKKKKDWKIEILETEIDREVSFENSLRINIPNEHWDSFCSIFDSKPNNNAYLNLNSLLNETLEDEMKDLRRDLRVSLANLYDKTEFERVNKSITTWVWRFRVVNYDSAKLKTPITYENRKKDIQLLYNKLLEVYGGDRGNMEMLISAIKQRRPLNTFEVFKDYEVLYATKIHSEYKKFHLYFTAHVDNDYHIQETINIPDSELADKIVEESNEVKVVRGTVYPKGGVFTNTFLRLLSDTIEEIV
jgi:hypothetical protein